MSKAEWTISSPEELKVLFDRVGQLQGWDFSRMHVSRDPVPWDYEEIVRQHIGSTDRVLDLGTGGGEVFYRLAPYAADSIALDHNERRLRVATANRPDELRERVGLLLADSRFLPFGAESFDLVLDRHAGFSPLEVGRILKKRGTFLTQQVGERNNQSIFDVMGWGSNAFWSERALAEGREPMTIEKARDDFASMGLRILRFDEYDIAFYLTDLASAVMALKWQPFPVDFDPIEHWQGFQRLLANSLTSRGLRTNEHRRLLMVQKGEG